MASKLLKQASLPHSREVMENFGWLTTKRTLPTALLIAAALLLPTTNRLAAQAPDPCAPTTFHAIACENSKPGNPPSEWDVSGAGDAGIQGFATDISVNKGQTVSFKIKTTASAYTINIYRLGYYGGQGARKIVTVNPSVSLPQSQPACVSDSNTGLLDCGNWAVSGSWAVPSTATSGVYVAKLIRTSNGTSSHIVFVVRDDASNSELLFQTADTTWQAYNSYGGNSFYTGSPAGRAYKLSYNRPFNTRAGSPEDWVFNGEYPMIRWLEANGYDVSYTTGVDTDRRGAELTEHRVFLSVGHDEYWSGVQRTNVETARALGVHLAFFSGNEVFWKTRWENSIAGPTTSHRTLVTYKETHDDAKTDPSPEWTGTWRDPRFSPPSDGGRPENALTGTLFMINDPCNVPLTVPAADGKMRFWRNTSVATLAAGQSATMSASTLGYECDEDVDNGFRPAGLVRLSTTTWNSVSKLLDYGSTYGPGPANHAVTLYRHAGGALVFGAGTIQWAWGLDGTHDRGASTPDVRMQQATVNLLADMNAQPATIRPGLAAATMSTDTTRPDSAITSPSAGATFPAGQSITISGTATDTGGVVGGVEVSVDGGQSWHPASGRGSWTYNWQTFGSGPVTIMSRAADDSANIEDTPAQITVNVGSGGPPSCPCSIWSSTQQPALASDPDDQAIEVGVKFQSNTAGQITALRFYKGSANTGTHVGHLWTASGALLATATFTGESASGWQQVTLPSPVTIQANTTYVASYFTSVGHYAFDDAYFASSGVTNGPLQALANSVSLNGVYVVGGGFPNQTWNASNYWVDVVFSLAGGPDTTPPTVTSTSPASNATGVLVSAPVTATFSEALNASSVTGTNFELRTSTNALVSATVSYNAATNTATLTPSSTLAAGATYTGRLKSGGTGIKDAAGNALAVDYVWSFTTSSSAPACPCTIWDASQQPALASDPDDQAIEVGLKFQADISGQIAAIRFYKGTGNLGPHVGHLWSESGTLLAIATFTSESGSGWQQVQLATPVSILANTTYVVSYYAPSGHYAFDDGYFGGGGVTNPPLRALANSVSINGVYAIGGGFPTQTWNASNYWVDVVFVVSSVDTTPPTITGMSPAPNSTGVSISTPVTATFNEPMDPSSIASSTFELRTSTNTLVPASVTYIAASRTAVLTPSSPLSIASSYTAKVKGGASGARDVSGNALVSDQTWSFSTSGSSMGCPCSIWPSTITPDVAEVAAPESLELGLNFQAQVAGSITGIRFYKGPNNTGTHIGNLWTSTGTLLATATFSNESASGWQQVTLGSPVVLVPNTTYVVSYFAPNGRHAFDSQYFNGNEVLNPPLKALGSGQALNGLYRYGASSGFPTDSFGAANYWVDVVFNPSGAPDTTPPVVAQTTPASNATGVSASVNVIAAFSELIDGASVNATTFQLRNVAGQIVPSSVAYNPASGSAVLTPTVLVASSVYTATLTGGFSGIRDRNGNPLAANHVWSFTTAAPPPATPDEGPGGPILIVTSPADPLGRYYAEILSAEGLNAFTATDISTVTASKLANYNVVILAEMPLTSTQVSLFTTWVNGGGNLIAMRPDAGLASLLGLSPRGSTLANAYLLVDTSAAPGAGIVGQTIQFHGTADRYSFAGGSMVASLYSNAVTPTGDPAVTLRTVGTGMAAAFTYDLATSIVETRQGNPMWAGQERDGLSVLRSSDLFFGEAATDVQPDWIDFAKVHIPQADEQQRLLANLITHMVSNAKPLPRFWYFPRGHKAVVVMTGDDHANNGTAGRFDQQLGFSPVGCSVADWECVRSTSYIYPNTPITNTQVAAYTAQGFEVGLHLTTGCANYTPATLPLFFTTQLADLAAALPSNPAPTTNRTHCIVWSDWSTQATVALQNGIRLDTTYYYWPGTWVDDRPGFFTGSGMPMRFTNLAGQRIDVFQAASQFTDESNQSQPATANTLFDNAIGPLGYYGAFTANMHTDLPQIQIHDDIVLSAIARGVPIVSAKQMLAWLDGRNASSFSGMTWAGNSFSFTVTVGTGARNLQTMLPRLSGTRTLTGITRGGSAVAFTLQTIKGVEYAVFTVATTGAYVASYSGTGTPGITIADLSVTEPASGTVAATFTLLLSSSSSQVVSVNYAPANGSATAPADYVAASGPVTFPIGTTSRTVSVTVNADAVNEAAETFVVNLSAASNATIDRAQAVGTIQNALVAPSAPTSLTATPVATPRVDLSWTHNDAFESGFRIERKTGSGGTYAEITTVGANVTTYGDTTVAGGTTYFYRVRAYDAAGNSAYTNEASATTTVSTYTGTGLYAEYFDNSDLTNLKKTRTDATVNFSWGTGSPDPAIGADTFSVRWIGQVQPKYSQSYTFYASTDNGVRLWVNGVQIINQWSNSTPLEKTGVITLTANQKYALVMEYYENTGSATATLSWSSSSQAKQIIPQVHLYPVGRPSTPVSLGASVVSSTQINLSWSDFGTNETGFKIERATGAGAFAQIATVGANVTTYNNTGLSAGTSYSYRVRATNANGDSGYSNTASATTSGGSTVFQAESATLSGAVVGSSQAGYTGTGYADYINASNDYVQWTVPRTTAGSVTVDFRYANGGSSDRPLGLRVNGVLVNSNVTFPPTGSWTTWTLRTLTVTLTSGNNTIRLTAKGSSGGNIDSLTVR